MRCDIYVDECRNITDYNLYEDNGFEFVDNSDPECYCTKHYIEKYEEFVFQKSGLKNKLDYFNPDVSEKQNMEFNGWVCVWGSGKVDSSKNFLDKSQILI